MASNYNDEDLYARIKAIQDNSMSHTAPPPPEDTRLIQTLADLESVMKLMQSHNIESLTIEGVKLTARAALPQPLTIHESGAGRRKVTDNDLLADPYAGMDEE